MTNNDTGRVEAASAAVDASRKERRKKAFKIFGAAIATIAACWGAYEYFYASRFVSTDNAYTSAETAQVTPAIGGIVREVRVTDTQHVRRGDVVVVLDDVDARLALDQAEAELGRAIRRVRVYGATDRSLAAQLAARGSDEKRAVAQLEAAHADFERAKIDLDRREALAESGSVSGDELTRARNAYATAQANVTAAEALEAQSKSNFAATVGSRQANAVLIDGTTEETNPEVELARAKRDQARINLERTVIRAPIDGVVAKRSVQVGQRLQAGSPVLAIVPVGEVHVDANFKEVQLDKVRMGQPVEVTSDLYGDDVVYHGVVVGLAGGTGSTFSTIPAQNATGNWIKVVQRVPVRIRLNPQELAKHPLQIGLSMIATIDTHQRQG